MALPPDIDHHAREQGVEFVKLYGLEPVKTCVLREYVDVWMCVAGEDVCM